MNQIPFSQEVLQWHKQEFTYADFTGKTSGTAFPIYPKLGSTTFAAGLAVEDLVIYVPTIFVAASMTDLQCIIGDGSDDDRHLATVEIGGTTSPISAGTWYRGTRTGYIYSAADTLDMKLTATGAALSALSAGVLHVFLKLRDVSGWPNVTVPAVTPINTPLTGA